MNVLTKEAAKAKKDYKFGFTTDVETTDFRLGLDESVVKEISSIKDEPEFVRDFRLRAYRHWW